MQSWYEVNITGIINRFSADEMPTAHTVVLAWFPANITQPLRMTRPIRGNSVEVYTVASRNRSHLAIAAWYAATHRHFLIQFQYTL